MDKAIEWFSKNHVAANFLMLIILLIGGGTWFQLRKEIFPETALDIIQVTVAYPGATPEEVEKSVIVPIEEEIDSLEGIKRITSTAAENAGFVIVETETGFDARTLLEDVKARIDRIEDFPPEEAEKPLVEELLIKKQVLNVAVSGDMDEISLRKAAEKVRDDLTLLPEITQVAIAGAREYEIGVEVPRQILKEYGLTLDQVANAIRTDSLDLPGGSVKTSFGEILIRSEGQAYSVDDLEKIPVVTRPDGSQILLGEIATIRDGFEEDDLSTLLDGKTSVMVMVYRAGNQDTIAISKAVYAYVEKVRENLPLGIDLQIWNDESIYLSGRIELLGRNAFFGLILVLASLTLFLRPSLAFFVTLGIPVSFAGAVMMMPYTDVSINMITLFAFILVLGIVVDDAIVVGENVYRRIRLGEPPKIAAVKGTQEVGVIVTFGVLSTVVAFMPMLGISGVSGKIWRNIPWIVIPTLLFSLVQSKLVLPAHLAFLKPVDPDRKLGPLMRFQRWFSRGLEKFVDRFYRPLLKLCLHNRYVVTAVFVSLFCVAVSLPATKWMKFVFFPDVEGDVLVAKVTMPEGISIEATTEAVEQLEASFREVASNHPVTGSNGEEGSLIQHILSSVGTQPFEDTAMALFVQKKSVNLGEVAVELKSAEIRGVSADQLIMEWREAAGEIPGVVALTFMAKVADAGSPVNIQLAGSNIDQLKAASTEAKQALEKYDGVFDVQDSFRSGKREAKLGLKPAASFSGLTLAEVARQVRQGFYGEEAQTIQRGRDEVKVMVRFPKDERVSIDDLEKMRIRTAQGEEVPFEEVAEATMGRSYSSITRVDRRRAINVTADVDTKITGANTVVESLKQDILPEILARYPTVSFSLEGEQREQQQALKEMAIGGILALILMYILMAIPLKSYVQPLIVMIAVPFGFVGAILGHLVMGFDLSIMSMCGIIALAGVVVNDSLVLVSYVNNQREEGVSLVNAAWEAGAARFRPIILTSLTTFLGLTPMLLETSIQARFLIPMAISLAFGILFATVITLILVPSFYLIQNDVHNLFKKIFGIESGR